MTKWSGLPLLLVLLASGVAEARRIRWKPEEKPPVWLKEALDLAAAELDNMKRKRETDYYCIGAELAKTFSNGDWELHFSAQGGESVWVSVGSDKSVRTSKIGFVN